ncbi:MAG: type I secretion protein [Pseudomonadota bacterium]
MTTIPNPQTEIIGTNQTETLIGTSGADTILGLAGDDVIESAGGADVIYGDFIGENLLDGVDTATSFAQYGETGAWTVRDEGNGHTSMSQSIDTVAGAQYEISFELAANYGANSLSGAVEVLWNGAVISTFDTNSAVFQDQMVAFTGNGGEGELTFRSIESEGAAEGPEIFTDQPVFYYETTKIVGGEEVTVKAIAEGQSHIYQVLNGKLHVFDPVAETYTPAGAEATVVVNAIGFNQEDNLIYGIAVRNGTDSLGNPVKQSDLVMYDAAGDTYRMGETPYRSWTADIDDNGDLWAFHSSMDRVTRIDLDHYDAAGNPVTETFKFPKHMVTDQVWDVGFDSRTDTFYGVVRPSKAGEVAKLFEIDISAVADGGMPTFSTSPIVGTYVGDTLIEGVPAITFGAFVVDGDGNLYAGGNGGDHDMNPATKSSGGIYQVVFDEETGQIALDLVADAPKAYSNDGAVDPRTMDPFTEKDTYANVLIRSPEVVETPDPETSYDDTIHAGADIDTVDGGYGEDLIVGAGRGDVLSGGAANDAIYGGAGPESTASFVSTYDEEGVRYDPFGNVLPEDDDLIYGEDGDDYLSGSAGHDDIYGGVGNDTLEGGTGFDKLYGEDGDDTLNGGSDQDHLWGGDGEDTMNGGSGHDTLYGDAGEDVMVGGSGDDALHGGDDNDNLRGGSGADVLYGDAGNDRLDGGSDNDEVFGGAGDDYIKGGSGDDVMSGGEGKDRMTGYTGDDALDGGAGNDTLYLGAGADIATGGYGSDRFVFRFDDLDGSTDRITDFRHAGGEKDRLDMRALDLLSDGLSTDEWIAAFVFKQDDNSVSVDLGDCTVNFDARDEDAEGALYQEICDGFLF